MTFQELEALRRFLVEINLRQVSSLACYYDATSSGFYHRHEPSERRAGDFSKASTATCVMSLVATENWNDDKNSLPWAAKAFILAKALLDQEWKSAGLPPNNPFTVAFILEAVTALERTSPSTQFEVRYANLIQSAEEHLQNALVAGTASILDYPPSAYLTQLVVRVLKKRDRLNSNQSFEVQEWAWREIDHQLALLVAKSQLADIYQLAYSIILVAALAVPAEATPDQNLILQAALEQLFEHQLLDGSWPRSRPLFHYPGVGSAFCFEYEMLVQLLQQTQLEDKLLKYLPKLSQAAYRVRDIAFKLDSEGMGWSSGHHPQLKGPESWSTASVFHFAHVLDRLVAEAIRRSIFEFLDTPYLPPQTPKIGKSEFAPTFLDCHVRVNGIPSSLRDLIFDRFVSPIANEATNVQLGGQLSIDTPMSAIFFGAPGTSKTELTKLIADYLRWPRLTVDPSHFVRNGLDKVQAEADRLFGMLAVAERIVVLLDEFDEMVRDRNVATEVLSRFLTTGLLPKLATINKNRRLVFIVSTNHIEHFDLAISRPGRFDLIVQIMPPTTEEKLKKWPGIAKHLEALAIKVVDVKELTDALTFDEFRVLCPKLGSTTKKEDAVQLIRQASQTCTLKTRTGDSDSEELWEDACRHQQEKIRIP